MPTIESIRERILDSRELTVRDSFLFTPTKLTDSRGCFYQSFRHGDVAGTVGHEFTVEQQNFSESARGVVRGVHGTLLPPGQAKIVTCHRGAILDVVVDTRVDSPTFGEHATNILDAASGAFVYVAEGLGHAFLALADTCVGYLCSTEYVPGTQVDINPLDPDLGLDWSMAGGTPRLSEKDTAAPPLAVAAKTGLLATYQDCVALYESLRRNR
jgi:NDP-hexose 5-epimerase